MKEQKWDEIKKGSKIILENNTVFDSFDTQFVLKSGSYYITGFWANACGLSKDNAGINEYIIPSFELTYFKDIIGD